MNCYLNRLALEDRLTLLFLVNLNRNAKEILHNSAGGHMLRTKLHTANEGGVAAGLGALDSPFLVDDL